MSDHSIHLICGSTGAGKTTYALALTERLAGLRFSIDEWMTALFWMDSPQPLEPEWSMARVERCNAQIWAVAAQAARRGVPCVLDLGFSTREQRQRFAGLATGQGLAARLHFVDVPEEERWCRVQARNATKGSTYQLGFDVTREMFDFVETLWQPPDEAEMAALNGLRV